MRWLTPGWPIVTSSAAAGCRPREAMPKAKEATLKALELDNQLAEAHTTRGVVYAMSGRQAEARQTLTELQAQLPASPNAPYEMATLCAALNEKDQAFVWLEKLVEARSGMLAWSKVNPYLRNLHGDPRFTELLRRVGLL